VFGNLGLVHMARGEYAAARQQLDKGLRAAVLHQHRLQGPILTDLADLDCRTGAWQQGISRTSEARPLISARYPGDAWRMALVDNVEAECLAGQGKLREAASLMGTSTDELLRRWNSKSLYGHDALVRAITLYQRLGDQNQLGRYQAMAGRG
jgi:hypothetical protein